MAGDNLPSPIRRSSTNDRYGGWSTATTSIDRGESSSEAGQSCACRGYKCEEEGNGRYDILVLKTIWKQWVVHLSVDFRESKA